MQNFILYGFGTAACWRSIGYGIMAHNVAAIDAMLADGHET
ncbi:hypothetical protein PWR63_33460 [Paraburkholderia sp. A2WS-5]